MITITVTDSRGVAHTLRNPRDRKYRYVSVIDFRPVKGMIPYARGGRIAELHMSLAAANAHLDDMVKRAWATEGEIVTVERS